MFKNKLVCIIMLLFVCNGCATSPQQVSNAGLATKVDINGPLFVNSLEDLTAGYTFDNHMAQEIRDAVIQRIAQSGKYTLAETKAQADFVLNIKVIQFTPGNRALRFWVGFGAGSAKLHFACELLDRDGNCLDNQKFQRFGAGSLRSGATIINQMKNLIIDYTSGWLRIL